VSDLFGKHPDAGVPVVITRAPDAQVVAAATPPDAMPPGAPPDAASASGPVDPYGSDTPPPPAPPDAAQAPGDDDPHTVDLASEVDRKSAQAQARFNHCYEDAAKSYTPDQPLAGEVDIAFRVMPTGEVQNAAAVKNTTGSDKLADCLSTVISAWTFPPSDLAEPAVFVRPFRFDGH
jgi:hypothetical protein